MLSFEITSVKEKVKGPTTVNQSIPIPIELLILLLSLKDDHSLHPRYLQHQKIMKHLNFENLEKVEVMLY